MGENLMTEKHVAQTHRLYVDYPADLLNEMSVQQIEQLAREAFYVRLYEQGKISSGRAGAQLGLSRVGFLDFLSRYGVSHFDDETDLAEDLRHAEQARHAGASGIHQHDEP